MDMKKGRVAIASSIHSNSHRKDLSFVGPASVAILRLVHAWAIRPLCSSAFAVLMHQLRKQFETSDWFECMLNSYEQVTQSAQLGLRIAFSFILLRRCRSRSSFLLLSGALEHSWKGQIPIWTTEKPLAWSLCLLFTIHSVPFCDCTRSMIFVRRITSYREKCK